ncbi:nitrate transporter [Aulographum hederae CBS 113979]|uniref:Nitrate/nitrite transporter n=1 Tax=Aulographum hederae CBS 113979 TaxID=1176131 RepID=A0A6G1H5R5_9PEZI|nr:nitrate transporter [Aulographum hederae CBS 113979]
MGADFTTLWREPALNPLNKKGLSIPLLNPIGLYGRVFFFSWFGFMIAFWSWYAFPPLLSDVIARNLHLTQPQIANSNIIALTATLLVRLVAGPACDRFGPRWTFAGCLLAGAIPTFCAGGVTNASGLMALRFFIGILGGSFVPCQVWTTGFFDKSVVGTANALTGGFGNAGGGITYFVMPAVYNSLVSDGLSEGTAWRVAFIVPGVLIVVTAIALVALCPDCPTGKWSEREGAVAQNIRSASIDGNVVPIPGSVSAHEPGSVSDSALSADEKDKKIDPEAHHNGDEQIVEVAQAELIQKPTPKEIFHVIFSPQTFVTGACYFSTFGAELAINSILGNYYGKNFPGLGLQLEGNWAAMFGLLNVVFRPLGGVVSDFVYRKTGNVWSKKIVLHVYCVLMGAFLIAIGTTDPHSLSTMIGLIAGMAFFLEGANGMNYSLVPHVHPYANGVVSGFTGACGNFGGIIFAIIFRYNGKDYGKVFWIIGVIAIALQVVTCWIPPIPRHQIGGR